MIDSMSYLIPDVGEIAHFTANVRKVWGLVHFDGVRYRLKSMSNQPTLTFRSIPQPR